MHWVLRVAIVLIGLPALCVIVGWVIVQRSQYDRRINRYELEGKE